MIQMWLLTKYEFDIDPENNIKDLTCTRCKKLLNDAYQTYCGCQYCHKCIVEYLTEGNIHCCGGKQGCNDKPLVLDENVLKSDMLNERVLKVKVICPNKSCTHSAELVQMEAHLLVCTKQSTECPYYPIGCDTEKLTKDTLLTHLAKETLPHTQLLIDLIQNSRNETEIAELKTAIERIKEECVEKENRIAALEQESRDKDGRISTLVLDSKVNMVNLANESKKKNDRMSALEKELKGTKFSAQGSQRSQYYYDLIFIFIIFGITLFVFGFILTNRISESKSTKTMIDGIKIGTNTIGVATFTVDRFDARRAGEEEIYSPYFYSHSNGYKLRLLIIPGGNGDGNGTHLSVFIQICKGEYDDILVWPCKYRFEVALINRSTGGIYLTGTHSYDTTPDNCKNSYDKPINEDNTACGYPKFVSVADLRSVVGLIVDDSVTIRCTVRRVCPLR